MKSIRNLALLLALFSLLILGCQKEEIGPSGSNVEPGTFKAYMTDSPGDYRSLNVQIVRVEAFIEGKGWVVLNNEARTVDVLTLTNGATMELAATSNMKAHAGLYTKLRIVFGDEHRLSLNAAGALGIGGVTGSGIVTADLQFLGSKSVEIEIDERVNARNGAEILLDFNVAKSVYQEADHFVLAPAITLVHDAMTGVRGEVRGAASAAVTLSNGANTYGTYINAQGEFLLRGLEEGVYDLVVVAGQASDEISAPAPQTIEGVVVVKGEITGAGTISF